MAADKWQLAALYNLAASKPDFRTILANAPTPADLQNSIMQNGWAGQFPASIVPMLSVQQLAAAQSSPDADEIDLVASGTPILEGGKDAWALDYITDRTVRGCCIKPGTTDPNQSKQGDLL